MDNITTIAVAIIGSSAFTAIINALIELIKNRTGAKGKANNAIKYCLLYNLQEYGADLCKKEMLSRAEYNQFLEMYKAYKSLDGDGYADRLKVEVDTIPIIEKKTA